MRLIKKVFFTSPGRKKIADVFVHSVGCGLLNKILRRPRRCHDQSGHFAPKISLIRAPQRFQCSSKEKGLFYEGEASTAHLFNAPCSRLAPPMVRAHGPCSRVEHGPLSSAVSTAHRSMSTTREQCPRIREHGREHCSRIYEHGREHL